MDFLNEHTEDEHVVPVLRGLAARPYLVRCMAARTSPLPGRRLYVNSTENIDFVMSKERTARNRELIVIS